MRQKRCEECGTTVEVIIMSNYDGWLYLKDGDLDLEFCGWSCLYGFALKKPTP